LGSEKQISIRRLSSLHSTRIKLNIFVEKSMPRKRQTWSIRFARRRRPSTKRRSLAL